MHLVVRSANRDKLRLLADVESQPVIGERDSAKECELIGEGPLPPSEGESQLHGEGALMFQYNLYCRSPTLTRFTRL